MKIVVFGASGFVGQHVLSGLAAHDAVGVVRTPTDQTMEQADLLDKESIKRVLTKLQPEVVINCAGIVENSDAALQNIQFSMNILESITELGMKVQRVIISGSAAEYGQVDAKNIPVSEDAPLNAQAGYGLSKLKEEQSALAYGQAQGISVVVARIFNPVGAGMPSRLLIPAIIRQAHACIAGESEAIEVSRLDSKRDYVNITDVASAFCLLAEKDPQQTVYNIGSGVATSNGELIDLIVQGLDLQAKPEVKESQSEPEALVAIQADVSQLHNEFGWSPASTIADAVKEIIHDTER